MKERDDMISLFFFQLCEKDRGNMKEREVNNKFKGLTIVHCVSFSDQEITLVVLFPSLFTELIVR